MRTAIYRVNGPQTLEYFLVTIQSPPSVIMRCTKSARQNAHSKRPVNARRPALNRDERQHHPKIFSRNYSSTASIIMRCQPKFARRYDTTQKERSWTQATGT